METRWEYLVEKINMPEEKDERLDEVLYECGGGGWELVTVIPLSGPITQNVLLIFKKPSTH
jgi:hypothetical protein